MKRIVSLLATVVALVALAAAASSAEGFGWSWSVERPHGTTQLKVLTQSQSKILRKRAVKVRVKSTRSRKVKVRVRSSTFDMPRYVKLAKPRRVKLPKSHRRTVKLKLKRASRDAIASCQGREIQVSARHSKTTFRLKRNTDACSPKDIDLSTADRCDFIAAQQGSLCLLPFPDDYYATNDSSSSTGKRIALKTASMPANAGGVHIDAAPYNLNDGFSPGQAITLRVPGLDTPAAFANTGSVPLNDLGAYARPDAPIVVIDEQTGQRWPIWTELDANATDPGRRALLIHPAVNFAAGHRYIVAMRDLEDGSGATLPAPEGFRYYRDDLPSSELPIKAQRDRFERIFRTLRSSGVQRSDLYLAWDFTVASDENIAGRVLKMRDDSLEDLGDANLTDLQPDGDSPHFAIDPITADPGTSGVTDFATGDMARRVQGTFEVPCYLAPDCSPGGKMKLDANGLPQRTGTYTASFNCMIPRAALTTPARPSLYGHGLLGSRDEATADPQQTLGNAHDIVSCATDELGLSSEDVSNTIGILQNLSRFPELADRLQQGLLDEIFLGRLMLNSGGFASDPAFAVDDSQAPSGLNPYVIDPSHLYYNGNSQGAIEGGALTAISPDLTRASLGVGGMNYSVLLNRSVDYDTYAAFLKPAYPDELERPLALSLIQMLWDRGESDGYAHRLTSNPLPNTPAHEVLMNVGFGDHQVSNFTADTMARTIGAQVHKPTLYSGRWPGVEPAWNVPPIASYPYSGSALVYWDSGPIRDNPDPPAGVLGSELGTNPPPIANLPNRAGQDPHELPRRTAAEQQMVSDFLQPNGQSAIDDECAGPCYDFTFSGP